MRFFKFMYNDDERKNVLCCIKIYNINSVFLNKYLDINQFSNLYCMNNNFQERMRAEAQPTGQQMMMSTNAWSCMFLMLAMTITGEGVTFCDFLTRHPFVILNMALLSAAAAIGQLFIYTTVNRLCYSLKMFYQMSCRTFIRYSVQQNFHQVY